MLIAGPSSALRSFITAVDQRHLLGATDPLKTDILTEKTQPDSISSAVSQNRNIR
jgi:hypothetical protein